jgi:hypothetical protein
MPSRETSGSRTQRVTDRLPRFGDSALNAITRMMVETAVKDLTQRRTPATVTDILSVLSMLMGEAAEECRIVVNPCRRLRPSATHQPERPGPPPLSAAHAELAGVENEAVHRALHGPGRRQISLGT